MSHPTRIAAFAVILGMTVSGCVDAPPAEEPAAAATSAQPTPKTPATAVRAAAEAVDGRVEPGGHIVWNIREGWGGVDRGAADYDTKEILRTLHDEGGWTRADLFLTAQTLVVDQYGNESRRPVYWVQFKARTLDRINFDNLNQLDVSSIADDYKALDLLDK